jgi:Zn-dependent protease with chaperone function
MPTPDGRPGPLLWLYGLIAVSLVSVGVAIGNLFFFSSGPMSLLVTYAVRTERCEAMYGQQSRSVSVNEFNACMADQARIRGSVLLGAALLLLIGTLVVTVAVPWREYRRLHSFGKFDQPAAQERFAELCRRHGLSVRRAPQLWVAGPGVHHAFTIAIPGGRPTIVIPARMALGPGGEFDAVVGHEIAHVLARDVTWVSALRGPLWLFVPVAAVASLPLFDRDGRPPAPVTILIRVVLLVAAVTVLARALLRLREHEADRYAARGGAAADLVGLFSRASPEGGQPRPGRLGAWARRLLARHPDPADRVLALRHTGRAFEGGLAQSLAVGFVAMMAMGTVAIMAETFDPRWYSWGAGAIASAAGAGVVATVFPSLIRRARQPASRPQWWRPVVGVAIGIVLGAFVSPVVTTTGQLRYPLVRPDRIGLTALAVVVLALSVAGVVALAISLAVLVAPAERPVVARIGLATAGLVAFAGMWPVGPAAALLDTPNDLRYWLTYGLVRNVWPALAVVLLLAYLPLARQRTRTRDTARERRLPWLVAVIAAVIAATAAILVNPATAGLNAALRAQQQRWWICTLAGVVVLAAVALTEPWPYAWARAVLASTATTAAANAAHYLYAQLAGRPAEPDASAANLGVAPVWLWYATVLLAPALVSIASTAHTPARGWSLRFALAGTAAVTPVVALGVVVVGVPGGVAMNAQQRQIASIAARYAALRHPLTDERAERVAKAAVLVLPSTWDAVDSGPVGEGIVSPAVPVSSASCVPLVRESFLASGQSHLRATGKSTFNSSRTGSLKFTDLTITVYSYDSAVVETILTGARDSRRACSAFSLVDPGVSLDFLVEQATRP